MEGSSASKGRAYHKLQKDGMDSPSGCLMVAWDAESRRLASQWVPAHCWKDASARMSLEANVNP